jgi:hypothetical protein
VVTKKIVQKSNDNNEWEDDGTNEGKDRECDHEDNKPENDNSNGRKDVPGDTSLLQFLQVDFTESSGRGGVLGSSRSTPEE